MYYMHFEKVSKRGLIWTPFVGSRAMGDVGSFGAKTKAVLRSILCYCVKRLYGKGSGSGYSWELSLSAADPFHELLHGSIQLAGLDLDTRPCSGA